jgi:hypothetical protein
MRAYDMAMVLIFVNCAFMVISTMGIIEVVPGSTAGFSTIAAWFATENFNIFGIGISTMTLLAIAFAAGTVVVLNSNPVTDKGLAMTTFTAVFWGSWLMTTSIIDNLLNDYRVGLGVFFLIFFIASTLIFINALVQISTGGQQSHV